MVSHTEGLSHAAGHLEAQHVSQQQVTARRRFLLGQGQGRGQQHDAGVALHRPVNVVVVQGMAHGAIY